MFKEMRTKMGCKRIERLIARHFDRECSAGDESLLAAHIENCARCSRRYDEYSSLHHLLAAGGRTESPDFSTGIMNLIREAAERPGPGAILKVAFSLYLLIAVLFAAYLVVPENSFSKQRSIAEQLVLIADTDNSRTLFANRQGLELLEGVLQ